MNITDPRLARINAALQENALIDRAIDRLTDLKAANIRSAQTGNDFPALVASYEACEAILSAFQCDNLDEIKEYAADTLRSEHAYDIIERCDLDENGEPVPSVDYGARHPDDHSWGRAA